MIRRRVPWTRNADAPALFESFIVAAVVSFLAIRGFLSLTDYPRVGGGGLHIAHMLWGGLLMLVALLLLLAFLDRSVQHIAAIVAGLGFGTFIDEIGKFVTADNDYFFRPAVALIYVVFIAAFLAGRALAGRRALDPDEAVSNALLHLVGAIDGPLTARRKARIRALLDQAGTAAPLAQLVEQYVDRLPTTADIASPIDAARRRLAAAYARLMVNAWAERAIVTAFLIYALAAVAGVFLLRLSSAAVSGPSSATGPTSSVGIATIAQAASTVAGAALVVRGVVAMPRSRLSAYRWFIRGVLVWILLSQVFVFYSSQLAGLGGLAIDLAAYAGLRFAISSEIMLGRLGGGMVPPPATGPSAIATDPAAPADPAP
jgi:hypothetical protein